MRGLGWVYLALLAVFAACTAGAPAREGHAPAPTVVALVKKRAAQPGEARQRDAFVPVCSAFAVLRAGRVRLATAKHCLPGQPAAPRLRYLAPSGWGHGLASVSYADPGSPVAYLAPDDPAGLVPFELAGPPLPGEAVTSHSEVYDADAPGLLVGQLTAGWFETSQSIVYGWSGSPALDAQGRAWGVVSKCPPEESGACRPGRTIVAALPAEWGF